MRAVHPKLALVLSLALAAGGCGGSDEKGDPLPAEAVSNLEAQLTAVENRVANGSAGACEDIKSDSYPAIDQELDGLPEGTDADVVKALRESMEHLRSLVDVECAGAEEPATETQPVPEETVPPEPVPEETVPEETVPEETTPVDPKDKEKEKGNGNGNNGNGNGGVGTPGLGGGTEAPGGGE